MGTERTLGFVCDGATDAAITSLVADPRVDLVEQDFPIEPAATQSAWLPPPNNNIYMWDLDRLDEPTYWSNDSTYDMCPEGRSVYAYVLDTGVRADHEQFTFGEPASRVVKSLSFDNISGTAQTDTTNGCTNISNEWHGTAVASKLAGTQVGSSKTKIVSLRIFNCAVNFSSQASWAVGAIEWIKSSNDPYSAYAGVVNWSGGIEPFYSSGDIGVVSTAVQNLVHATWIPFFVAADNFAGDACQYTPASLAYTNVNKSGLVFTVGGTSVGTGTDRNDYRFQTWTGGLPDIGSGKGSNGGRCVSIYAPAVSIFAARTTATNAYDYANGTSFSAPLVAGVAARYMEKTGIRNYAVVFDHLLSAAQGTGAVVNNVNTPEYWICKGNAPQYYTSRTSFSSCFALGSGWVGANGGDTPVHMAPTYNESSAGMIYSDMTCP